MNYYFTNENVLTAMLLKMRQEMDEMMHRLPPAGEPGTEVGTGPKDDTPLQNKSTSTTKVSTHTHTHTRTTE